MSASKTVVLVDDEADFHIITKIKFSNEIQNGQFLVHCFDNPFEALTFIQENGKEIDVVFTDLKMGKLDGFQLIGKIQEQYPELPCYIISAFDSERTRFKAQQLNTVGYMQKPIDYDELKNFIHSI